MFTKPTADALRESWRAVDASNQDIASFNLNHFNFYIHAPTETDRSSAPEGCEAVTILIPVPPLPENSIPSMMKHFDTMSTLHSACFRYSNTIPRNSGTNIQWN